jgi:hypothetical protein
MGGNALTDTRRIKREEIPATVQYISEMLNMPGMTYSYIMDNLMGSAGKQTDSGDLDIAVDRARFNIHEITAKCQTLLQRNRVSTNTLKGGQIQTAWPICGEPKRGYVQVDFIAGDPEFLKFTHWSPGKDVSPYKGVFISTLFGVLAKMVKEYELHHPETGERIARVGLRYDLDKGFYRQWEVQRRPGQGVSPVDCYTWESKVGYWADKLNLGFKLPPHFNNMGYITNPEEGLRLIYGAPVKPEEVTTFEDAWAKVKECYPERVEEARERTIEALMRSGAKYDYTEEQLRNLPVW